MKAQNGDSMKTIKVKTSAALDLSHPIYFQTHLMDPLCPIAELPREIKN